MQQRHFIALALLTLLGAVLLAGFAPAAWAQADQPGVDGACAPATPCAPKVAASTFAGVSFNTAAATVHAVESQPVSNGFGLAWAVMILLVAALLYALISAVVVALGRSTPALPDAAGILIPILSVIGLGVAIYLTFVETRNVKAVCGPVGDCNTVQSSPYARLFGFLPVGLLGLVGYVGILVAWAMDRFGREGFARIAALALFGMALFGVLFSIYLTYLELFVIHAVCIWCLSSAVIMAFILILSVGPAMAAIGGEAEESEADA